MLMDLFVLICSRPLGCAGPTLQKSDAFRDEHEFRFVVIMGGPPSQRYDERYLQAKLAHPLEYASII